MSKDYLAYSFISTHRVHNWHEHSVLNTGPFTDRDWVPLETETGIEVGTHKQ